MENLSAIAAGLIPYPNHPADGMPLTNGYSMTGEALKEQERIEAEWRQTQEKQAFLALKVLMIQAAATACAGSEVSVVDMSEALLQYALKGVRNL